MANLSIQNTIAMIWDFDKTLSPHYMQQPLFKRYGTDEAVFWREVSGLEELYIRTGVKRVSKDTLYLNHILTYVRKNLFKGLNNALLKELGAEIEFYKGIPEFFEKARRCVVENETFARHNIAVEHYVVSTGLREMIMGSKVAAFMEEVWACEFVEVTAEPGYLNNSQGELFDNQGGRTVSEIGYLVDNTSKTRAIFEINKGANKESNIDVNATIAQEDRRIPFQNMIYVADGPSDVPAYSIINQYGGTTFAVYEPRHTAQFKQVANLQKSNRVQGIGEADYTDGSLTYMWLINAIECIAERIVKDRERLLSEKVGSAPRHITSAMSGKIVAVTDVARVAVETVAPEVTNSEQTDHQGLRPAPPQRAADASGAESTDAAPAA